jgi:hypothetical protein
MKRILVVLIGTITCIFATEYWTAEEVRKQAESRKDDAVFQYEVKQLRGNWQTWSYIHEMFQTAAFIASMQVTDSLDPEFGGIIEGEDALTVVETDNTQEAIWVWCRFYELFSDTTYFVNIRRAWIYVMNHPAYQEEGATDYYRVWNCALAQFCESKYRHVFNDTTYSWYADTCAQYMGAHPLPLNDPINGVLNAKVTGCAAGMLYQYGKDVNNQAYMDTAVVYGDRVRQWIEQDPVNHINDEEWAMSGGTCVWGMCRSIFDADTASGVSWLTTYLPLMKYYQPSGTWNNSWNIWYANAYNYSGRITQNASYLENHHALTDSLLVQDYDDDGGVPPTSGWSANQDHAWISAYMVFMGFEALLDSVKDYDAGVNGVYATGPRPFFLVGDTIEMSIRVANYGFQPLVDVYCAIDGPFFADTTVSLATGEEDTIHFNTVWVPADTGLYTVTSYVNYTGDERVENDTLETEFYIQPLRLVTGSVTDGLTGNGIYAQLYFQFIDETGGVFFDSTETDSVTGDFSAHLIDSLYRAYIYTEIPYPDIVLADIYVTPDSISDLDITPESADILIVNRDNEARYAEYITEPLDTLGITYKVWAPVEQGIFPFSRVNEFKHDVIVWFTGQTDTENVSAAEQESLMVFLENGSDLLISGQNIGEELTGTVFYEEYLHAQLVSDSLHALPVYPDTLDELGQQLDRLWTAGGCPSQYSRDVITSDGYAQQFLYYETALTNCAGIWYHDPVFDYRIIYCAFGIEAVHNRPAYMSRKDFLEILLGWFGVTGACEYVEEQPTRRLLVYPNPARTFMTITTNIAGQVKIFDVTGRLVKEIPFDGYPGCVVWDMRDAKGTCVANGIYFVMAGSADFCEVIKAVVVR